MLFTSSPCYHDMTVPWDDSNFFAISALHVIHFVLHHYDRQTKNGHVSINVMNKLLKFKYIIKLNIRNHKIILKDIQVNYKR